MSLSDWLANRWIVAQVASIEEMTELFAVVDRDLEDAAVPRLSEDWRLGIAYNAALQLATLALAAEGYRPGRERAHERAILSLKFTLGTAPRTVDLIDAVRRKRNLINYERAGTTSSAEADEFYDVAMALRAEVVRWMKKNHGALCPPGISTWQSARETRRRSSAGDDSARRGACDGPRRGASRRRAG